MSPRTLFADSLPYPVDADSMRMHQTDLQTYTAWLYAFERRLDLANLPASDPGRGGGLTGEWQGSLDINMSEHALFDWRLQAFRHATLSTGPDETAYGILKQLKSDLHILPLLDLQGDMSCALSHTCTNPATCLRNGLLGLIVPSGRRNDQGSSIRSMPKKGRHGLDSEMCSLDTEPSFGVPWEPEPFAHGYIPTVYHSPKVQSSNSDAGRIHPPQSSY